MSQLARLHQTFEDITGLSRGLNQALLVAKRVAANVQPSPDQRTHGEAIGVLAEALGILLTPPGGDPKRPWVRQVLEELSKETRRSEHENRLELKSCLDRLNQGLNCVTPADLQLLDQIGAVLDQSSAALYRRIIRT